MSAKHNRYYEPIEQAYSAALRRANLPDYALIDIATNARANVNKRIAALRLYVESIPYQSGLTADDLSSASASLFELSREADGQRAYALADVAFDLADALAEDAAERREWARCGRNPNVYYGTPYGY